jgi:hypothetical protein
MMDNEVEKRLRRIELNLDRIASDIAEINRDIAKLRKSVLIRVHPTKEFDIDVETRAGKDFR